MARIIIEVSDSYFAERGDIRNVLARAESKGENSTALFADFLVFEGMTKIMEDVETREFTIDYPSLDSKGIEIFNGCMLNACALLVTGHYKEAK